MNPPAETANSEIRVSRLWPYVAVPLGALTMMYAAPVLYGSIVGQEDISSCSVKVLPAQLLENGASKKTFDMTATTNAGSLLFKQLVIIRSAGGQYEYSVNDSPSAPQILPEPGSETGAAKPDILITDPAANESIWSVDVVPDEDEVTGFRVRIDRNC